MTGQAKLRCAIYTRKSSEEGLDQDFNSLEAQREACEAYVKSQSHEGWELLADRLDDGGFSGGNMDRPALGRLMQMIREGKVDVIVIYKIDRLTRSLMDFARLAETFDQHKVSFVSVTQQFNTTTSMGRLMLNVLLSFAQFEREITGERIRDKIAASKKKGMWMGGVVPMGYEARDRRLTINADEAAIVRQVFVLYLEVGSVPTLVERLQADGIRTAVRSSRKGLGRGNLPFTRGHLYKLLCNPIYIGRVQHKDVVHTGQHEAIIDLQLWSKVQTRLADNTQGARKRRTRAIARTSLLAERLWSETGNRFIHTHANKGQRRYRYYVEDLASPARQLGGVALAGPARLPAPEIENAVVNGLLKVFQDHRSMAQWLNASATDHLTLAMSNLGQLTKRLHGKQSVERDALVRTLIKHVAYQKDKLRLTIDEIGLRAQLGILGHVEQLHGHTNGMAVDTQNLTLSVPLLYRRRGRQVKLAIEGQKPPRPLDETLITVIVRANDWARRVMEGGQTLGQIAAKDGVSPGYVSQVLPLAFLAPSIVESILSGTQPAHLNADQLVLRQTIPLLWSEQLETIC